MSSSSSTLIQKLSEKNIKLIDKIGEGTYGEIFIAEWNEQSQLVAVKIVTFESSNESIKNMFNREVYFSNKLKNHPNVLKLYDHFLIEDKSDDGEEFTIGVMIMEKMDVDLMDYILSKNSYISLTECRKIFSALVDVIGFLHSQSIAHCDIKPENVLLKLKEDRISKIKICDFGFTIQWQVDLRSSLSFGTNEYRSPELLRSLISNKTNQQSNNFNHQNSDNNNNNNDNRVINVMNCDLMPALNDYKEQINYEKADVWSLGVTMFACFTGLFPFVFQSETNQLVKLDNFSFLSRHFNNPKNPFYSQFLQNAKIYDYSSHYSQSQQRRKPVNLMKYVNNVVYRGHEDDDDYAYYESEFGDLVDLFEGIFEPSPSLRFAITDVHTHRWFILHENNGMDPCNSSFYIRRCSVPRSMSIDDIENSAHNNNNNITSSSNYPRKRRNSFSRIKGFINSHFK